MSYLLSPIPSSSQSQSRKIIRRRNGEAVVVSQPTVTQADLPDSPSDLTSDTSFGSSGVSADLSTEIAELQKIVAGHDLQLRILTRAILDNGGWLKGRGSAPLVDVSDDLVDRFVREVESR